MLPMNKHAKTGTARADGSRRAAAGRTPERLGCFTHCTAAYVIRPLTAGPRLCPGMPRGMDNGKEIPMLMKPPDYDQALSYGSDFSRLPPGGYVCRILKMAEHTSASGGLYVEVSFDIAEGEQKGFFEKLYRHDNASQDGSREIKWRGIYRVFPLTLDGFTNPSWKGLLTCIEMSNDCQVDWHRDYDQFRNRLVGLMFREEEFERSSGRGGRVGVTVRPFAARPVDFIRSGDFEIPQRKPLPEKTPLSDEPLSGESGVSDADSGFVQVEDEELPF